MPHDMCFLSSYVPHHLEPLPLAYVLRSTARTATPQALHSLEGPLWRDGYQSMHIYRFLILMFAGRLSSQAVGLHILYRQETATLTVTWASNDAIIHVDWYNNGNQAAQPGALL